MEHMGYTTGNFTCIDPHRGCFSQMRSKQRSSHAFSLRIDLISNGRIKAIESSLSNKLGNLTCNERLVTFCWGPLFDLPMFGDDIRSVAIPTEKKHIYLAVFDIPMYSIERFPVSWSLLEIFSLLHKSRSEVVIYI